MATLQKEVERLRKALFNTRLVDGRCMVCKREFCTDGSDRQMEAVLDHDHACNLCRGLLCRWCNMVEGMYSKDGVSDAEKKSAIQRGSTVSGLGVDEYERNMVHYLSLGHLPMTYPRQEMYEKPVLCGEYTIINMRRKI